MKLSNAKCLQGEISVPGDKSISHRAVMFGSIAKGTTEITGFLNSADCNSTIACFSQMGIDISKQKNAVLVNGKGLHGLTAPSSVLDAENSGTTVRLMSGILSAQSFSSTITGDSSICKRPMKRIMEPLSLMGADITSINQNDCAPLSINGSSLHGISYHTKTASAQVKSSILLAGLYADSKTSVTEPQISRNHSEIMLRAFGADLSVSDKTVSINPATELYAQKVAVPGDISSAAYFIAAGLITPNSEILIKNVGINETRDGIIRVVQSMGGNITLLNERTACGEKIADILVKSSSLKAVTIEGAIIPTLIDELPVIAILAAYAKGTTVIKDAAELKVKECNRIDAVTRNLQSMGGDITPTDDGFIIRGGSSLHSSNIETCHDHRIAMSFAIADLIADGNNTYDYPECVCISYPSFYDDLRKLQKSYVKFK
ncbi:MAG: 3-phosphoshikimate 1-carboxyvinyltransferase [Lachnospiraceae bacterium]|nr:3-phosphoshikimate 1-carboxyvinyltransferase [Lachnospiraceae bacterium]